MWLNIGEIADEVEQRIHRFAHRPPVLIRDSAFGVLPGASVDDGIVGAVFRGKVYLFRDQLPTRVHVQRALFHELLHYGVRRFLSREDYIKQMHSLAARDGFLRAEAMDWTQGVEGRRVALEHGQDYAMARGVDEALATLAEPNAGEYLRTSAAQRMIRTITTWAAELADFLQFPSCVSAALRGYKNEEARGFIQSVFSSLERDAPATSVDWAFTADPAFSQREEVPGTIASIPRSCHVSGKILSIIDGRVRQKVGRRETEFVEYNADALDRLPAVGDVCDVVFDQSGKGAVKTAPSLER